MLSIIAIYDRQMVGSAPEVQFRQPICNFGVSCSAAMAPHLDLQDGPRSREQVEFWCEHSQRVSGSSF